MARCDQGYLCDVCGEEVESIRESDLYLRFVTGELSSNELLGAPVYTRKFLNIKI